MATSSVDDAPRGMDFLFSLNRLNVAGSRAQGLVNLICSPELLKARCRTPDQMRLASALCRLVELASSSVPRSARLVRGIGAIADATIRGRGPVKLRRQRRVEANGFGGSHERRA